VYLCVPIVKCWLSFYVPEAIALRACSFRLSGRFWPCRDLPPGRERVRYPRLVCSVYMVSPPARWLFADRTHSKPPCHLLSRPLPEKFQTAAGYQVPSW
jgi:hypothetical protein